MFGDDAAHDRQAEPAAALLGRIVRHEQLVAIAGGNARTVVGHDDSRDGIHRIVPGLDDNPRRAAVRPWTRATATERLDGVVHEVDDHAADLLDVDADRWKAVDE